MTPDKGLKSRRIKVATTQKALYVFLKGITRNTLQQNLSNILTQIFYQFNHMLRQK